MKNILELLEITSNKFPEKIAFANDISSISYRLLLNNAKKIGSALNCLMCKNQPILVCIDKSIECISTMLGIVYSGNMYVVMDVEMPIERASHIYKVLNPVAMISTNQNNPFSCLASDKCACYSYDSLIKAEINEQALTEVRRRMIDTDPVYALFTSGSTGIPKGAVINHHNVLAYSEWVSTTFGINENTIFGNQSPFYFSMSVLDIYSSIRSGATFYMIPRKLFSFPLQLLEFLNEKKVNTIYWVPSALNLVANWKALDYVDMPYLKKILFAGEVMPVRQLNIWRRHLPDAFFANLYGPTEVTDICTYYVVNREFKDDESLPIGNACNNCDVFILNEENKEAKYGEKGELCVRGSFLSPGYYGNWEKSSQVFVQNPLNKLYPEAIYRTGDIVKYNGYGELEYVCRKDFQIKHMGYRIELGEIETAASSIECIKLSCCIYDEEADHIVLIFEGTRKKKDEIMNTLKDKLPQYMWPDVIINVRQMPLNANGKMDRVWLKNNYKNL